MHQKVCDRLCACSFSGCASSPGSAWHSCCCISHWQLVLREQLLQLASLKHSCSSLRLHLDESVTDFKNTHRNTEETISVQLNFIGGVLFCSKCNKLAGIDTMCNKSRGWNNESNRQTEHAEWEEKSMWGTHYTEMWFLLMCFIFCSRFFNSLTHRQLYLCRTSKEI